MTILPQDYYESFTVHKGGERWGRIPSKMFCGDTAVTARACRGYLFDIADELRAGSTVLQVVSDESGLAWTLESLDELQDWLRARDRPARSLDQPRTDPHDIMTGDGFDVRYKTHVRGTTRYHMNTLPLLAALDELQSGAEQLTIRNAVTGAQTTVTGTAEFLDWADELDVDVGSVLREQAGDLATHHPHQYCPCSRCRSEGRR